MHALMKDEVAKLHFSPLNLHIRTQEVENRKMAVYLNSRYNEIIVKLLAVSNFSLTCLCLPCHVLSIFGDLGITRKLTFFS